MFSVAAAAASVQLRAERLPWWSDSVTVLVLQGEQGIMLTTLLAAYHQMLRESVFIS